MDPGPNACDGVYKNFSAVSSLGYMLAKVGSTASVGDLINMFDTPTGQTVTADRDLKVSTVKPWSKCAGAASIKAYATSEIPKNSLTLTMPTGTTAFLFELLPIADGTFAVNATYSDGTMTVLSPQSVTNGETGGAKLFGAYASGTATIKTVNIVMGTSTNKGFYLGNMHISNTVECIA